MKTAVDVSRRMLLAATLGLPAAVTAAALTLRQQRRFGDALAKPTPKDESERQVLAVIADYDYLRKLVPVLRPGGLFVTHNMDMAAPEYLAAISTDPALESTLVSTGSGQIAATLKKR